VEAGSDVNTRDGQNKTPLMQAVTSGSQDVVNFFLNRKVDVNSVDQSSKTALHYASARVRSRRDPEFDAEQSEIVKLLLQAGAILEARDCNGCTPLMLAVSLADEAVVKCMLDCKADVLITDSEGETCIEYARQFCSKNLAKILEDAAAHQTKNGLGSPPAYARKSRQTFFPASRISKESGSSDVASAFIKADVQLGATSDDDAEVEVFCEGGRGGAMSSSATASPSASPSTVMTGTADNEEEMPKRGAAGQAWAAPEDEEERGAGEDDSEAKAKKEKKEKKDKKEKKRKEGQKRCGR